MKSEFIIGNVTLKSNIVNLSSVFRITFNKIEKVVDLDRKQVIKFYKKGSFLKIFEYEDSSPVNIDILPKIKSDYEIMKFIDYIIYLINLNFKPKILNSFNINGEVITNKEFNLNEEILVLWTWDEIYKDNNSIIITLI